MRLRASDPTATPSVRPPRLRFVALAVTATLVVAAGSFGFTRWRADAAWHAMTARTAALRSALEADGTNREPLWGEASTEDTAFACYARAVSRLEAACEGGSAQRLKPLMLADAPIPASARASWQPALTALRDGAHAARIGQPDWLHDSTGHSQPDTPSLDATRWLLNAVGLEVRALRAEGRDLEAVRTSLDGAALGLDIADGSLCIQQLIGTALVKIAIVETWTEDALDDLSANALAFLDQGLERVDRRLPVRLHWTGELLGLADRASRLYGEEQRQCELSLQAWRYGFSSRWQVADAVILVAERAAILDGAPNRPWPERRARIREQRETLQESGNEIAAIHSNCWETEATLRHIAAEVRLLRAAIALRRGEPAPRVPDPFGPRKDSLMKVIERADGKIELRSAGTNSAKPVTRICRQ